MRKTLIFLLLGAAVWISACGTPTPRQPLVNERAPGEIEFAYAGASFTVVVETPYGNQETTVTVQQHPITEATLLIISKSGQSVSATIGPKSGIGIYSNEDPSVKTGQINWEAGKMIFTSPFPFNLVKP